MEYHYTLTKDDYVAFNMHHAQHSERVQKVLRVQRWMSLIFLLIPLLVSWVEGELLLGMFVAFALLACCGFYFIRSIFTEVLKRTL
ncbi:hypothetical protein ABEX78_13600 [Priestia megaterium]